MSSRLECQLRCELQTDPDSGDCKLFNYCEDKKLCELSFCPPASQGGGSVSSVSPTVSPTVWESYLRVDRQEEGLDKMDYRGNPNPIKKEGKGGKEFATDT